MSETDPASEIGAVTAANGTVPSEGAGNKIVDAKSDQKGDCVVKSVMEKGDAMGVRKDEDVKLEDVKDKGNEHKEVVEKDGETKGVEEVKHVEGDAKKENDQQAGPGQEVKDAKNEVNKNEIQEKKGEKVEEVKDVGNGEKKSEDQGGKQKEVEELEEVKDDNVGVSREGEEKQSEEVKIKEVKDVNGEVKESREQKVGGVEEVKEFVDVEHGDNKDIDEPKGKEEDMKETEEVKDGQKGIKGEVKEKIKDEQGGKEEELKEMEEIKDEQESDREEEREMEESTYEKGGDGENIEEQEVEDEKLKGTEEVKEIREEEEAKEMKEESESVEEEKEHNEKSEENGRKRKRSRGRVGKKKELEGVGKKEEVEGVGKKEEVEEIKGRKRTKDVFETYTPTSLDRPQRERKTVERLVEVIEKETAKNFLIEKGRGTPLKDIPNVAYKLSRRKPEDIKFLHMILFGRRGKAVDFKNHVSQFSGFVWHGNEDKERTKIKEKLDKYVKEKLLDLCDVFDIQGSKANARKEDLVMELLDFMVAPHPTTDVLLEAKEQHSSRSKKRKRVTRGSASRSVGSSGKRSRKRRAKAEGTLKSTEKNISASESEDEDEHEKFVENDRHYDEEDKKLSESDREDDSAKDEDNVDEHDESSEKSSEETKKSSKRKTSSGRMKSRKVTAPIKAASPPAKSLAKTPLSKHSKVGETNSSKEKVFSRKKKIVEVPQKKVSSSKLESKAKNAGQRVGKGKGKSSKTGDVGPSNEELKKMICEILKEVDFNTATFTDILKKLAGHFKTDLTERKGPIKQMIQEELTRLAEADDENEDDDEDDE